MKRSGVMIAVVLLVAILFAGNGLLIVHAAGPNGQGAGASDHSNSGNGHNTGSGTNDHSSGSSGGGNSQGSGTVDQNSGTNDPSSQPLILNTTGGVVNVGGQHYIVQQSGQVISAQLVEVPSGTLQINPLTSHLSYHLNAIVEGMSASGIATFQITGFTFGGIPIEISGNAHIVRAAAAVCLPNYDAPNSTGYCPSGDTSEVPAFFVGIASIQVTAGGVEQSITPVPMLFQSAYLNPFGGPIVFGTADNFKTMQIVTTYDHATVDWSNVVDQAFFMGTLGTTPVAGMLTQVAQEHENLVTGNAKDHGTINFSFLGGSPDWSGHYSGSSMTPSTPKTDCSDLVGVACTNYGFVSVGTFHATSEQSQNIQISGSYGTLWGMPAFGFNGTITATVS